MERLWAIWVTLETLETLETMATWVTWATLVVLVTWVHLQGGKKQGVVPTLAVPGSEQEEGARALVQVRVQVEGQVLAVVRPS